MTGNPDSFQLRVGHLSARPLHWPGREKAWKDKLGKTSRAGLYWNWKASKSLFNASSVGLIAVSAQKWPMSLLADRCQNQTPDMVWPIGETAERGREPDTCWHWRGTCWLSNSNRDQLCGTSAGSRSVEGWALVWGAGTGATLLSKLPLSAHSFPGSALVMQMWRDTAQPLGSSHSRSNFGSKHKVLFYHFNSKAYF